MLGDGFDDEVEDIRNELAEVSEEVLKAIARSFSFGGQSVEAKLVGIV